MRITQTPCAADALFGTKAITVNGKSVGIAGLCDALADVRAMDLTGDEAVKAVLVTRVGKDNYIPATLVREYADALLAEYRSTEGHRTGAYRR